MISTLGKHGDFVTSKLCVQNPLLQLEVGIVADPQMLPSVSEYRTLKEVTEPSILSDTLKFVEAYKDISKNIINPYFIIIIINYIEINKYRSQC